MNKKSITKSVTELLFVDSESVGICAAANISGNRKQLTGICGSKKHTSLVAEKKTCLYLTHASFCISVNLLKLKLRPSTWNMTNIILYFRKKSLEPRTENV